MAEERKYYDSEAKRKWQKENTRVITFRLQKKTDHDILEYFEKQSEINEDFSIAGAIKMALRKEIAEANK